MPRPLQIWMRRRDRRERSNEIPSHLIRAFRTPSGISLDLLAREFQGQKEQPDRDREDEKTLVPGAHRVGRRNRRGADVCAPCRGARLRPIEPAPGEPQRHAPAMRADQWPGAAMADETLAPCLLRLSRRPGIRLRRRWKRSGMDSRLSRSPRSGLVEIELLLKLAHVLDRVAQHHQRGIGPDTTNSHVQLSLPEYRRNRHVGELH